MSKIAAFLSLLNRYCSRHLPRTARPWQRTAAASPSVKETPAPITTSARKVGKGIKRGVAVLLTLILLLGVLVCGGGYAGYNYVLSHYFTNGAAVDTAGATAE